MASVIGNGFGSPQMNTSVEIFVSSKHRFVASSEVVSYFAEPKNQFEIVNWCGFEHFADPHALWR